MYRFLRHPVRVVREPFGTAGLIVAIVALVAAVGGTAFAAAGLNAKQKKEVKAIAKQFAGKPGATGATGAQGNPGPAGAPGRDGTNGTNGNDGESVTVGAASNAECPQGGTEFSNATGSGKACNGQTGFTSTLPSEKTETGQWAIQGTANGIEPLAFEAESFPIRLAEPPATETNAARFIPVEGGEGEPNESTFVQNGECAGTVQDPKAAPGHLCVFAASAENLFPGFPMQIVDLSAASPVQGTIGTTGFGIRAVAGSAGAVTAQGSWAVTAE
ncbi:MAG: collagen-like triple helix repeat-containing protein [Solirubrobacterales bacterium]